MIHSDILSTISFEEAYFTFADAEGLMVLHSAGVFDDARYSFICFEPFARFYGKKGQYYWNDTLLVSSCPLSFLKAKCDEYVRAHDPQLPPFQGGCVGYFSYEFAHLFLNFPTVSDKIGLPDCVFYFFDKVVAYDHWTQQLILLAFEDAALDEMRTRLKKRKKCKASSGQLITGAIQSNFSKARYEAAVQQIRTHIIEGDIFQANLTQAFCATKNKAVRMTDWYWKLTQSNPAPYSALMQLPNENWLLSASPERFLRVQGEWVSTEPIKGTRKRLWDKSADVKQQQDLKDSVKDRAENMMIVDLMRNDLSKVCALHSVVVESLCALKSFETVHHLVSKVVGRLEKNQDAFSLLKATFPAGSITGAPKLKAMEIISQLEGQARGPYCGCLGYISFTGWMDMAVTIRSYMLTQDQVYFSAGGGIILDSVPEAEYQESLDKVARLREILTEERR